MGHNIRLYDCMESNAQSIYSKTIKVYKEVYEYIEDNTGSFADLELNNFSSLFIIYFGFLIVVFIVFFFFQILPFYYSKLIDFYRQLNLQRIFNHRILIHRIFNHRIFNRRKRTA